MDSPAGRRDHKHAGLHRGTHQTKSPGYQPSTNTKNGLRRTNADKRKAVEIALREFGKMSDVEIARLCGVNDKTVAAHRPASLGNSEAETRLGADGKLYRLPRGEPEERAPAQDAPPVGGTLAEIQETARETERKPLKARQSARPRCARGTRQRGCQQASAPWHSASW